MNLYGKLGTKPIFFPGLASVYYSKKTQNKMKDLSIDQIENVSLKKSIFLNALGRFQRGVSWTTVFDCSQVKSLEISRKNGRLLPKKYQKQVCKIFLDSYKAKLRFYDRNQLEK